jgi:hypothetical protein
MTGLRSTGLTSPGTLHGRASVPCCTPRRQRASVYMVACRLSPSALPLEYAHHFPTLLALEDFGGHDIGPTLQANWAAATEGTIRLHPLHWTTETFLRSGAGIPAA